MTLIGLIVALIGLCLLWWALKTIMGAFGLPSQIQTVVTVLFVVIVVLWLVSQFGLLNTGPILRLK
jgi:uncharacterized membrane protein YwzB